MQFFQLQSRTGVVQKKDTEPSHLLPAGDGSWKQAKLGFLNVALLMPSADQISSLAADSYQASRLAETSLPRKHFV